MWHEQQSWGAGGVTLVMGTGPSEEGKWQVRWGGHLIIYNTGKQTHYTLGETPRSLQKASPHCIVLALLILTQP